MRLTVSDGRSVDFELDNAIFESISLSLSLILCFVARKISFLRNQTENIYTC